MSAINPEQADELLRLTGELASQILHARAVGRTVSRLEAMALTDALHLIEDVEIELPDTLIRTLDEYDELCSHQNTECDQKNSNQAKMIRLPQVSALPQRIFSMLGLG